MKLSATVPLSIANNVLTMDLSNYATLNSVSSSVYALVNNAPANLNALSEFSTAMNNDPVCATTIPPPVCTKQCKILATLPLITVSKYCLND